MTPKLPLIICSFLMLLSTFSCSKEQSNVSQSKISTSNPVQNSDHFSPFSKVLIRHPDFAQISKKVDFDGDGTPDQIIFSRLRDGVKIVAGTFDLIQPWPSFEKTSATEGSNTAIAIVHGKDQSAYLIRDKNPISILDTQAATESSIILKKELSKSGEPALVKLAAGDVIMIPTEAGIDSYLYWNGKTYVIYESLEMP